MTAAGVDRIITVPMYPQYSATTTAASTDAFFKVMMRLRVVPGLRVVGPYYQHPAYHDAMLAVVNDDLATLGWEPEHFLFSFHGVPRKYVATRRSLRDALCADDPELGAENGADEGPVEPFVSIASRP